LSTSDVQLRAKALLQLGRIYAKFGDFAQAKEHLENASDIDREVEVFSDAERSEIAELIQRQAAKSM